MTYNELDFEAELAERRLMREFGHRVDTDPFGIEMLLADDGEDESDMVCTVCGKHGHSYWTCMKAPL